MGTFSIWHWLIVLVVVLVLFGGGGKIKKIMGDMGSGVTAFKKGLKDEDKSGSSDEAKGIQEDKTIQEDKAAQAQAGETVDEEEKDKVVSG